MGELASMSKSAGVDCCIAETVGLMKCTAGSSRTNGCAAEFLAMRECNRMGGKELVSGADGSYEVVPGKSSVFGSAAASLVSAVVPKRSLQGMADFGGEYAKSLGIAPGEIRF